MKTKKTKCFENEINDLFRELNANWIKKKPIILENCIKKGLGYSGYMYEVLVNLAIALGKESLLVFEKLLEKYNQVCFSKKEIKRLNDMLKKKIYIYLNNVEDELRNSSKLTSESIAIYFRNARFNLNHKADGISNKMYYINNYKLKREIIRFIVEVVFALVSTYICEVLIK